MTILKQYQELLCRPVAGIVHFNDVFTDHDIDFDAELTTTIRNIWSFSDLRFSIGKNPKWADYGINLLHDLIKEQRRIIDFIQTKTHTIITSDVVDKAVISIVNKADRNSITTTHWQNGEDFHLAITDNGLEIYVVPLIRLQALETRNKVIALYRIPNNSIPFIDGNHEQFRSSIIANVRYFPEILEPIFEYKNKEELITAKQNGTHPTIIPIQTKLAEFAFSDKFGNVRISVLDNEKFIHNIKKHNKGEIVHIRIWNSDPVKAVYVHSLKEIPENHLGIYQNIADETSSNTSYWEIVKKSEDCNNDTTTATTILQQLNPNFEHEEFFITNETKIV